MKHVLNQVPTLVNRLTANGQVFIVVLLATIQATAALAFVVVLHHLLR